MRKKLFAAVLVALLAVAGAACSSWGPGYCYGEGGQPVTCESPGSPGTGG